MVSLYLNKDKFNTLINKKYKRKNTKIIKEGCIWYLKKKHLLKCLGWDNISLNFINNMKDENFYCFNFISNKDFTGWLHYNII